MSSVFVLVPADRAWAQAEGLIRGQVIADADGAPIVQASVTLASATVGGQSKATTGTDGRFAFGRLEPGEYVLTVSADGFATREVRFTLEPREIRAVTLALDVGRIAVGVEVSGESSLPSTHSPSSTVLTAERLEGMPAAQGATLPEALVTLAPGMIRGHDDFIHVRGHEVALNPMINGVAFWENPHSLFSGGLSPAVIQTANVMTGGFPAEYGNRFGGVVDIVTKSGFHMRERGTLAVTAGEAGRRYVSGEWGGSHGRFAYYALGTGFTSDRFLSPPDPRAIHDSAYGGHAFLQFDAALPDASALRAVLMADGANFEIPRTPLDVGLRPLAESEQRTRQQTAIVGWTRAWRDTYVSASAYQRWSRSRLLPASGPLTARADLVRDLLTIGAKADVTRASGRHTFKAGLDVVGLRPRENLTYDYDGYRELTHLLGLPHIHVTGNAITFAGTDAGGQVSAYAQDTVPLGTRVTADFGVRLDHHALVRSVTHASPRINVAVQAGGGAIVHGSYNRFFVPPPVEGVLSSAAGLTQSIGEIGTGLPAPRPTVEDQIELGIAVPVHPLRLAATGYFRASDNPVHTTVWPDSRIYSYASFDRARAYGLEIKADLPDLARYGLSGFLNYALGRAYFYNPVTGGFVTEAGHITESSRFLAPMDQTHTLTGGLTYSHAKTGFWTGANLEYGSGTPIGHGGGDHEHGEGEADHEHLASGPQPARVPQHFTANLSAGFGLLRDGNRRSRISFQIDVENITNRSYLIAQEGEFSATQFSVPRLVTATVRVRF